MSIEEADKMEVTTAVSDADYPQVGLSPFDHLPGFTKPTSDALVDNRQIGAILKREGYGSHSKRIKAINFFVSPIDAFQYALYSFGITDIYIVVMVNKRQKTVYGHHIVDLTQEYSIADDIVNHMKNKSFVM